MTTFNESEHPRASDGSFTTKRQSEPQVALTPQPANTRDEAARRADSAARLHARAQFATTMTQTSVAAGLGGIMPQVFDVIQSREEISDRDMMALDSDDVTWIYEGHVAPAIDAAEADIAGRTATAEPEGFVEDHLVNISREAGLDVMGEVFSVIRDRGSVPDTTLAALTADDVTALYEGHIAPGIDSAEQYLRNSR